MPSVSWILRTESRSILGIMGINGHKWVVGVDVEEDFPDVGIEEGYMILTNDDILQCFEPVVNRILELIRSQIKKIQAQNGMLKVCY